MGKYCQRFDRPHVAWSRASSRVDVSCEVKLHTGTQSNERSAQEQSRAAGPRAGEARAASDVALAAWTSLLLSSCGKLTAAA
eukprot:scaffold28305_cov27-Tisochrysis_lutea.AAC.5